MITVRKEIEGQIRKKPIYAQNMKNNLVSQVVFIIKVILQFNLAKNGNNGIVDHSWCMRIYCFNCITKSVYTQQFPN